METERWPQHILEWNNAHMSNPTLKLSIHKEFEVCKCTEAMLSLFNSDYNKDPFSRWHTRF